MPVAFSMHHIVLVVCFWRAHSGGDADPCPTGDKVCATRGKSMIQISSYSVRPQEQEIPPPGGPYDILPNHTTITPVIMQAVSPMDTDGSGILVLVLGYGEPDRAPQLISNVQFLIDQGPGVQCIVFIWSSDVTTDGFPSRCRLVRTHGAFMSFLRNVPPDALAAAQQIFLMADDLDLMTDKPIKLLELARLMNSHNLDIASPAMIQGIHYSIMKPTSDHLGRYVDFIEWQAQMVSIQTFNTLLHYLEPQITGCWGYDEFIYSMLLKEKGSAKIAILNTMTMKHNGANGLARNSTKAHACGRIGPTGAHWAAWDIKKKFREMGLRAASKTTLSSIPLEEDANASAVPP